jgi:hypothetical protein
MKETGNEAIAVLGRTDHWHSVRVSGGHDGQRAVPQTCISDATFYTSRKKYGGMEVSEAQRLKALEEENARLKKLLAESMLEHVLRPMIRL